MVIKSNWLLKYVRPSEKLYEMYLRTVLLKGRRGICLSISFYLPLVKSGSGNILVSCKCMLSRLPQLPCDNWNRVEGWKWETCGRSEARDCEAASARRQTLCSMAGIKDETDRTWNGTQWVSDIHLHHSGPLMPSFKSSLSQSHLHSGYWLQSLQTLKNPTELEKQVTLPAAAFGPKAIDTHCLPPPSNLHFPSSQWALWLVWASCLVGVLSPLY